MENFEVALQEERSVTIIKLKGYVTQPAGEQLRSLADTRLTREHPELIIDFAEALVINSPGVAALLDLVLHIVDDLEGAVYLVGLDRLKNQVLTMAGVIPLATSVATLDEAIRAATA